MTFSLKSDILNLACACGAWLSNHELPRHSTTMARQTDKKGCKTAGTCGAAVWRPAVMGLGTLPGPEASAAEAGPLTSGAWQLYP